MSFGNDKEKVEMYMHTCQSCGCVFVFLSSDVKQERVPNGNWYITCPYCHTKIELKEDQKNESLS